MRIVTKGSNGISPIVKLKLDAFTYPARLQIDTMTSRPCRYCETTIYTPFP